MHMACRGCGRGTTNTPYYVVVRRSYSYVGSSMRYIDRLAGLQPSTVMCSRVLGLPTLVSEYVNGTAAKHMDAHGMPRVWPRHYQHPILRSSTPIVQLRW